MKSFEIELLREYNSLDPRPSELFKREYDGIVARAIRNRVWTKEEEGVSKQELRDYRRLRQGLKVLDFVTLLTWVHRDAYSEQTKRDFEDKGGHLARDTWERLQPVMRYSIHVAFLSEEKKPTPAEVYLDIKKLAGK